MRWNQFDKDPIRASALGDILLGAAYAGDALSETKLAIVHGQVAKSLGTSELPAEVVEHMRRFDAATADVGNACRSLRLTTIRDRVAVMRSVSLVIRGDGFVERAARAYALRLAVLLGIQWDEALDLVGLPMRPITGPRPRPVARPATRTEMRASRS